MIEETIPDRPDLEAATERMRTEIETHGVKPRRVMKFGPMWEDDGWSIHVEVETDAERDSLDRNKKLLKSLHAIADEDSCNPTTFYGMLVQSQETVDRDMEGNWFFAFR